MTKKAAPVERIRIAVRVDTGRLTALDAYGQEAIDKLPAGRLFIELDTEEIEDGLRNFFFAGVNLLYENIPETGPGGKYPTPNHLRRQLLIDIGFSENIMRVDGIKPEPRSMARGKMTADEIKMVTELCRAYCEHRWGYDPFQNWADEQDAHKKARH